MLHLLKAISCYGTLFSCYFSDKYIQIRTITFNKKDETIFEEKGVPEKMNTFIVMRVNLSI